MTTDPDAPACVKVAYASRKDAMGNARHLKGRGVAVHASPYHCPICGAWHLTSMSRKAAHAVKRREKRRAWMTEDADDHAGL